LHAAIKNWWPGGFGSPHETLAALLLAVFVIAAAPVAEKPAWKAGAASAKITPEKSMWMAGYAGRTKPSEGVELDLFAKAFVLTDEAGAKFTLL
jgi:neutral ceramidase